MINLFENYSQGSWDLHYSLIVAGYVNTTVCLSDDAFLPSDVTSPYLYFTGFDKVQGSALYFNQVPVPDYWEILGTNSNAEIFRFDKKRGHIHYAHPAHQRLVKAVDWYDESGRLRVTDHYNNKGYRFSQTTYNIKQEATITSYFTPDNKEVIVVNHLTKDVILNWKDKVYIFKNKSEFVVFYLKEAGYDLRRILYNSLSTPFLTAMNLPNSGQDVLFWQEPITDSVPGNMRLLLDSNHRQTKIVVQEYTAYTNLLKLVSPEQASRVAFLGFMYPFARQNNFQNQALILTNSDQIEHLESIVSEVPTMHYHIGAITEMSSRLMDLAKYSNVSLYPNITTEQVKRLYQEADFYLDINHQNEILSATRAAFENNLLILAFTNTSHGPDYTAPSNIFSPMNAGQFKQTLKEALGNRDFLSHLLDRQREHAHVATPEDYKKVIG